jgi:hypothetical protein
VVADQLRGADRDRLDDRLGSLLADIKLNKLLGVVQSMFAGGASLTSRIELLTWYLALISYL